MASASASSVGRIIAQEIHAAGGSIPFIRFMELALYSPGVGYYERSPAVIGKKGDFVTSAAVGAVFGELLAFQFCEWLAELSQDAGPCRILEAGAHQAILAADILHWIERNRPSLFDRLSYVIVEPSATRRSWQLDSLNRWISTVKWVDSIESRLVHCEKAGGTEPAATPSIVFSNELLDSFPCHRVGWDAREKRWFEWAVRSGRGGFEFCRMKLSAADHERLGLSRLPTELVEVLPDGFTTERTPDATQWWATAARTIERGYLVTIDYGLETAEFLLPHRFQGTLRTYRDHRICEDVLAVPGQQDLTAHVDFQALREAGENEGLETLTFHTQEYFLTNIFRNAISAEAVWNNWDSTKIRQFRSLTHPEHFGRAFKVLVQRRR